MLGWNSVEKTKWKRARKISNCRVELVLPFFNLWWWANCYDISFLPEYFQVWYDDLFLNVTIYNIPDITPLQLFQFLLSKRYTQRRAWTQNPEIKICMLSRQPARCPHNYFNLWWKTLDVNFIFFLSIVDTQWYITFRLTIEWVHKFTYYVVLNTG